jgi:DUF4097 and DUF4098 domain-containing protein YvlB
LVFSFVGAVFFLTLGWSLSHKYLSAAHWAFSKDFVQFSEDGGGLPFQETSDFSLDKIHRLELEFPISMIHWQESPDDKLHLFVRGNRQEENGDDKSAVKVKQEDGVLNLSLNTSYNVSMNKWTWPIPVHSRFNSIELDVQLPRGYQRDLSISSVSSPIQLANRQFQTLKIETVSGPVNLKDIKVATLETKSVSGDIILEDVQGPEWELNSVSGKISSSGQKVCSHIESSTVSGKVRGAEPNSGPASDMKDCDWKVTTVSGDIEFSTVQ